MCVCVCVRSCQLPSIESADSLISSPDAKLLRLGCEIRLGAAIGKSPGHSVAKSHVYGIANA